MFSAWDFSHDHPWCGVLVRTGRCRGCIAAAATSSTATSTTTGTAISPGTSSTSACIAVWGRHSLTNKGRGHVFNLNTEFEEEVRDYVDDIWDLSK